MATPNSLGLDFDNLNIQETQQEKIPEQASEQEPAPLNPPPDTEIKIEKKKPYVNTERVKTGGPQRDKLSEEALAERMARMKEQNEKIKQRRLDVQADEDAFRKTQESERAKLAKIRKVQETVDRTREQNAKRKMDKIQSREWDSGKPTGDWKHQSRKPENATSQTAAEDVNKSVDAHDTAVPPREASQWARGGPRGGTPRGKSRGRGRGASANAAVSQRNAQSPEETPDKPDTNDANIAATETPTTLPTPSASTESTKDSKS